MALMNRLGYTKKFALLALISLVAFAVVVCSLYVNLDKEIRTSKRELEGLALIKPISRAVQLMQQHRAHTATLLGGSHSLDEKRVANEKDIAGTFKMIEEKLPPDLASREGWRDIQTNWEQLRQQAHNRTIDENFAAHTRLISQIRHFEMLTADEYALTVDFEAGSYYMIDISIGKLPDALEYLGQIRAYGIGILSGKQATEHQKVTINTLAAQLDNALKLLSININKTGRLSPERQGTLSAASRNITNSAQQIVEVVKSDIITGQFATSPDDFYMMATEAIDKGYAQMYESLLPTAEALIKARIHRAENVLRTSIGIALLMLLVVAYFAIGIYYATIGSIQSLARSARVFAAGDMRERIDLGTRDELSQVGDSFNEMADGFNALLAARRQDETRLRELNEHLEERVVERTQKLTLVTEALYQSETRLRLLLDSAAEAIYGIDLQGNCTFCNPACLRLLGYQRTEELIGKNMHELIHHKRPDGAPYPEHECRIYQAFRKGEPTHVDDEVLWRADDSSFPAEYWSHPQLRDGAVVGAVVTFLDITARTLAQEKLLKLSRAVENSPASVVITNVDGTIEYVNPKFCKVTGYSSEEVIGKNPSILSSGIQSKAFYQEMWSTILAGNEWKGEIHNRKKNGEMYLEHAYISPIRDEHGVITHFVAVKEDITERRRIEEELQKADKDRALHATRLEDEARLRAIVDTALDAVIKMDSQGVITGWNNQAAHIFGWAREEAVGRLLHETIIPPQHREAHAYGLKQFLASGGTGNKSILNSRTETLGMHRNGHEFPIELSVTSVQIGGELEFNAFIRDITKKKESEEVIWKQANFDTLTGLPNRRMFHDRTEQEIKKAHRAGLTMALLFIDLDHFKEVNDALGHSMGDLLLVEAAHRITDCVRETDTVARLGGDEFIAILSEIDDIDSIERVAGKIRQKLAEPFQLRDETAHISASIGITLYPDDATDAENLLMNADQAMYAAKSAGRNRFGFFTNSMQEVVQSRLRLIKDLRSAVAAGQFRVYYQPIVNLATGCIDKAEALIRWQHPTRGLVSPAEFIPLAEETGLIVTIGDWVFMEAARQVKRWRALYGSQFQISVNKSPVQFRHIGDPYKTWLTYLQELCLPGKSMAIEITEHLLLDAESGITDKLLIFRDAGIQISIDDFGTGYSSLSYLKKFDIDYLKIDQSFVRNLATDSNDMALSEAIIVMAHKLGLKVIAEGVETAEQRDLLIAAGCDYAQGYYFSRPVPPEEFELLLQAAQPSI